MIRFEKLYCDECMCAHWVEVVSRNRQVCHGRNYFPQDSATHYVKHISGGYELREKVSARDLLGKSQILETTDWIFAEVQETEEQEQIQDW